MRFWNRTIKEDKEAAEDIKALEELADNDYEFTDSAKKVVKGWRPFDILKSVKNIPVDFTIGPTVTKGDYGHGITEGLSPFFTGVVNDKSGGRHYIFDGQVVSGKDEYDNLIDQNSGAY